MKVKTGIESGRGLGDAIADLAHLTGLDRVAKYYEKITGKSCGCDERQQALNRLLPLGKSEG